MLENAKAEGHITLKWSNLVVFGGSESGKTALLNLLLNKEPVRGCYVIPQVKVPPKVYLEHEDPGYDSDGISTSAESSDSDDSLPEYEKRVVELETHYILVDESCNWKPADIRTVKTKFAQALKSRVERSSSLEESRDLNPLNNPVTGKFPGQLGLKTTPLHQAMKPKTRKPQTSLVIEELHDLLPKHEASDELYKVHWIYTSNSAGQAPFLDLATEMLRYNSTNIIVVNLNEKLMDNPNCFYSYEGMKIGKTKRPLHTLQQVKGLFRCKYSIKPPPLKGVKVIERCGKPNFVVAGSRYDKYKELKEKNELEETLEKKNEYLNRELAEYEDVRFDYNKDKHEVIFPVNMLGRTSEEHEIAERIRKIVSQSYVQYEIPIRWFLFQLELKLKVSDRGYMSINECYQIGETIDMTKDEVEAALCYFHDMSIYLYFHSILPSIVFINPQALFDKLSHVIGIGSNTYPVSVADVNDLTFTGIFRYDFFDIVAFRDMYDEVFSCDDFLKLMKGLEVVYDLLDGTGYYLPCAQLVLDEPLDINVNDSEVEPLILVLGEGRLPRSFFPTLVTYLLGPDCPTRLNLPTYVYLYRNKITFQCSTIAGIMTIVDGVNWIAVRYCGPHVFSCYARYVVLCGLEWMLAKFSWCSGLVSPKELFICRMANCSNSSLHFCRLSEDRKTLICMTSNACSESNMKLHVSWFDEKGTYETKLNRN